MAVGIGRFPASISGKYLASDCPSLEKLRNRLIGGFSAPGSRLYLSASTLFFSNR
jgi:hypothetical protein